MDVQEFHECAQTMFSTIHEQTKDLMLKATEK